MGIQRKVMRIIKNNKLKLWGTTCMFLLILFLTGCWDSRELEERSSVIAIGIDKSDEQRYRVSVQLPVPMQIAGSRGGGGGDAFSVLSSTGDTVLEGLNHLQRRVDQELFMGHMRLMVISEEVAKEGISDFIDAYRRDPRVRRLLWPIVVKGEALEMLNFNPTLEQVPSVFLMDLIGTQNALQVVPELTLGDLFVSLSKPTEEPLLYYGSVTKEDVRQDRLAVLRDGKMAGTLADEELIPVAQIRDQRHGGSLTMAIDEEITITFRPKTVRREMACSVQEGKPHFRIHLRLEGDVTESTEGLDLQDPSEVRRVERAIETHYERLARNTVQKLQQFGSDGLLLGTYFRGHCDKEWIQFEHWGTWFPQSTVDITYEVDVRRIGMRT